MPKTYTITPVSGLKTCSDLNQAISRLAVTAMQPPATGPRLEGLILTVPFRTKGAGEIRTEAKRLGARWNGKDWSLSYPVLTELVSKGDIRWFLDNNLITGIQTSTYTNWVWDGKHLKAVALDIRFDDRNLAKKHGAFWDPGHKRWFLPATRIESAAVNALNGLQAIAGYIDPATGTVENQPSWPPPAASLVREAEKQDMDRLLTVVHDQLRGSKTGDDYCFILPKMAGGSFSELFWFDGKDPGGILTKIDEAYKYEKQLKCHSLTKDECFVTILSSPAEAATPGSLLSVVILWKPRAATNLRYDPSVSPAAYNTVGVIRNSIMECLKNKRTILAMSIAPIGVARSLYETLANSRGFKPVANPQMNPATATVSPVPTNSNTTNSNTTNYALTA